ncbi:MAG TPA: hypothetical protein VN956_26485 [Pyrinomonadaceae bacterium]|nr:hypothetical protein [Pyrinomonadaceae bacterium]
MVKEIVVQTGNSLAGPSATAEDSFGNFNERLDTRPPQILRNDQFGSAEPETSGVVFSAPLEDLMVPADLRKEPEARKASLPCLFLEDLWIGYRLDVRDMAHPAFTSIHQQQQRILFTQSGKAITGPTEDYIEREQAVDPDRKHTSTDLITYNGFSSGQAKDYLRFLKVDRPSVLRPGQPFEVEVTGYGKSERLTFGRIYEYRLRNVFLGGISCESDDPRLNDNRFSNQFRQQFPFYRARALRPGEVLTSLSENQNSQDSGGRTIYVTSDDPETNVTLVPSPIDIDTSRYHGLIFQRKSDTEIHAERKHVRDISKFFEVIPPEELNYFYDPDVYGIVVRATLVNGDQQQGPQDLIYLDNTYCGIRKHLMLPPLRETYGDKDDWQNFRPIVISFRASQKSSPRIRSVGRWRRNRRLEVEVPPAGELHLSIVPIFDLGLLSKTAAAVASNAQLHQFGPSVASDDISPIPSIAEHVIKVIHAVRKPRQAPVLICENPRNIAGLNGAICVAGRKLDSEFATVFGRIEIDAASIREVRLEGAWADINDNPNQQQYSLDSANASTTPRSVIFREHKPVAPAAGEFRRFFGQRSMLTSSLANFRVGKSTYGFVDQFSLQCAEDKVFLGQAPETPSPDTADNSSRLNFKDQRRKLVKLNAVAVSRFADKFGEPVADSEIRSNRVVVDVPSTLRLTAPRISHIVPIRKDVYEGDKKVGSRRTQFGVRMYLRRPAFQSSVGERLAIACLSGAEMPAGTEGLTYATLWGEDPIERGDLTSTTRVPRATDFVTSNNDEEGVGISDELYPRLAVGGAAAVIYRDNVELNVPGAPRRSVSLASFALRYEERQRLWYADVQIQGDFVGWCRMALYRHQPHALPARELSETFELAYAAILYGEPVAWVERKGNVQLTIGPVFDPSVSFDLDSLEYRDGVSHDLTYSERSLTPLQSYRIGKALYFEAVIPKKHFDWSLLKKRFAHPVASVQLDD